MDAFRMMEAPSGSSGSAFCTVNRSRFTLMSKIESYSSSVIAPSLRASPALPTSASIRLLPAKRHARRRGACHEALFLVGDVTLDKTERFSALDDPPGRPKLCGPHGLQEIDLQLDGRKGLALRQRAGVGDPHGGIGDVAKDASVQRPHRIRMLPPRRQLDHRLAGRDCVQGEADKGRDRGWRTLAIHQLLECIERRRHRSFLLACAYCEEACALTMSCSTALGTAPTTRSTTMPCFTSRIVGIDRTS